MSAKQLRPCSTCALWRLPDSRLAAEEGVRPGTTLPLAAECRRRVHVGQDGLTPNQPYTPHTVQCGEHMQLPAPARLPTSCTECRYWVKQQDWRDSEAGADFGLCCVWAPRWNHFGGYSFPITKGDFLCGDGVSINHQDPDAIEDDEPAQSGQDDGVF